MGFYRVILLITVLAVIFGENYLITIYYLLLAFEIYIIHYYYRITHHLYFYYYCRLFMVRYLYYSVL